MDGPDLLSLLGRPIEEAAALCPDWTRARLKRGDEFQSKPRGLEVACDPARRTITTIWLYAGGVDGFRRFAHPVAGIGLDWTRPRVRRLLGKPSWSRGMQKDEALGTLNPWDRYDRPAHSLHFEYRPSGLRIQMITLMVPEIAPRPAD